MPPDPLSDEEISRLRLILQQDERVEWLYANVRRWGAAILATVAGLVAFRNDISTAITWFASLFQGPR